MIIAGVILLLSATVFVFRKQILSIVKRVQTKVASSPNPSGLTRGQRNNNLGNIKINPANDWVGKIPESINTDGVFEQFESTEYGVRAMIKLLFTYINSGDDKVSKIINRYAPKSENDTKAYIKAVHEITGMPVNVGFIATKDSIEGLVKAMIRIESEYELTDSEYEEAAALL